MDELLLLLIGLQQGIFILQLSSKLPLSYPATYTPTANVAVPFPADKAPALCVGKAQAPLSPYLTPLELAS
ncbi:uncharacterized protein MEPE_05168 [Melanopsichium pennsylvanicum]|uniref:Uncharacterized protein n=1 Tax=Melanopsichium pennsylvanicum TaxID=63383 RepID=A0AAJ5C7F4_9BASI|nr:uncharacterized protein MEPE_05168 [Melanopsichium pennsylvanicum]